MFLQFDKNRMHLQVVVGTLEKYEPTPAIIELQNKVKELHDKLAEFQKSIVIPALEEIEKAVADQNKPQISANK